MRKRGLVFRMLLLLVITMQSCSPKYTIEYDYDKTVNFTKHKTYSFYKWPEGTEKVINRITRMAIQKSVADQLNDRGLNYVNRGGDILVSLFILFSKTNNTRVYFEHYKETAGDFTPSAEWAWGNGDTKTKYDSQDYKTGTLVIDIFNGHSKKLIWQGVASQLVDENPGNREYGISKVIEEIFSHYPVSPKKQ